ncbi:MAG: HAMP domain-containing histidine kinase [Bacteroidia bacterium]|nr:HAMP domain-containing histidine kinase [Bacteroidia bacterium]
MAFRNKINRLNLALLLGLVAIIGILVMQLVWTRQAFTTEGKKFGQQVHITLLRVVDRLYHYNNNVFPLKNPINKISNDYYIVNVNNDFDADVLEYCLRTEFEQSNLLTDFEYAIYNCGSDEMVYGNYISFGEKERKKSAFHFPKQKNLVYYFAIRFPKESNYLLGSMKFWLALTFILIVILLIYLYSIFTILQQKKYSELQKDFINNMTHEFKTPLSSILIASNYLIKQDNIHNNPRLEKYTRIIIEQSTKLNNHIGKILDIARSDETPPELHKQKTDLLLLLRKAVDSMEQLHEKAILKTESELPEYWVSADEFHFTNLVYNLIDNSVKYCNTTPEITIYVRKINPNKLSIEFADNGIGLAKKELALIFNKFYRVPKQKGTDVNGFGLGLYYVKKICQLHQWEIKAESNAAGGLSVFILMPI